MFHIERFLETTVRMGATDLYLHPGKQPQVWIDGQLRNIETSPVSAADLLASAETLCSLRDLQQFRTTGHVEFEYNHKGKAGFRVSYAIEHGEIAAVFSRV